MRYVVESTHSLSDPAMEGREYFSTNDAWTNAAVDYSSTDADLAVDNTMNDDVARIVDNADEGVGSVTLSTGEVITVKVVDTFESGPFETGNGTYRLYP